MNLSFAKGVSNIQRYIIKGALSGYKLLNTVVTFYSTMTTAQEIKPNSMESLIEQVKAIYPEIQIYEKTAMHMEDTESCMVTLPCTNKGKRLLLLVANIS